MQVSRPLFGLLRHNLRAKVTLSAVLPLVLILAAFTAIENARHREATLANLSFVAAQTAQVIENSLQHEMLSHNLEGLQHILNGIGEDQKIGRSTCWTRRAGSSLRLRV